jgi:hypothetical protein
MTSCNVSKKGLEWIWHWSFILYKFFTLEIKEHEHNHSTLDVNFIYQGYKFGLDENLKLPLDQQNLVWNKPCAFLFNSFSLFNISRCFKKRS